MATITTFLVFVILLDPSTIFAQLDSIYDQGVFRTYIVHLPIDYNEEKDHPLVFNLHGMNSNAAQQESYTQMNTVADTGAFVVVYPNAIDGSWDISGEKDVAFLSNLIDSLEKRYALNKCVFFTGLSRGGFMSYKLACSLPKRIKAIAPVAGNMLTPLQNSCTTAGMPVMHIHGTADALVKYDGSLGVPGVEATVNWWVQQNNCSKDVVITKIPDVVKSDSCDVEEQFYGEGKDNSEVFLYKINNGGHTWPGKIKVPALGNTNQDINASGLIWQFFRKFCSGITDVKKGVQFLDDFSVYPNPSLTGFITIDGVFNNPNYISISIYNQMGQQVYELEQKNPSFPFSLNTFNMPNGIYYLRATVDEKYTYATKVNLNR